MFILFDVAFSFLVCLNVPIISRVGKTATLLQLVITITFFFIRWSCELQNMRLLTATFILAEICSFSSILNTTNECIYIHNNQRAHLHGLPIHVRLFLKMQPVDNYRYHNCRCHVNWDHVLHIDSPQILDKQMPYNTKQLMQGWWTETINEQNKNTSLVNYNLLPHLSRSISIDHIFLCWDTCW